ncbi:MAG: hypothetical protein ACPG4Z_01095, partial [Chitinophagales bacterium]
NMRKFIFLVVACFLFQAGVFAQPGWAKNLNGNLNELDSMQIKECLQFESMCNFGTITIDSTTDLTRLTLLNLLPDLSLYINLKTLPKEFATLELNKVYSLSLSGNILDDVSNFPKMDSLEDLIIFGFQGDTLLINNEMPNLQRLELKSSYNLKNIESVTKNDNFEQLVVQDCNALQLVESSFSELKYLAFLSTKPTGKDFSDFDNFSSLEQILLRNVDVLALPDNLPKSLNRIYITDSRVDLEVLNKIKEMKTMEKIELMNVSLVWEK